jgi:hypothetical protein
MPRNRLLGCALLLLSQPALAAPGPAPKPVAQGNMVSCTIRSLHGLSVPGGVDKRLRFLRKQLSKPPFSAYKTIKLLEAKQLEVPQKATRQIKLPTGKILKLTFREKLLERREKVRLRLHLSITPPKKTKFLPGTVYTIADRGTLLVAGDRYRDGTLVVGITCQHK